VKSGKLDNRITLQVQSTTQDAYGQQVETWAVVATVWAEVRDVSGKEYFAAQATQNTVQTKIRIRWRDGVVPAMRVVHGSVAYNIEAVLEHGGRKSELLLMCSRND
jgi:SPP1 family predicted phage head-tail adaptor